MMELIPHPNYGPALKASPVVSLGGSAVLIITRDSMTSWPWLGGLWGGFSQDMGAYAVQGARRVPDEAVLPRKWGQGKGCVCLASRQVTEGPGTWLPWCGGRVTQGHRGTPADSGDIASLKWHYPVRGEEPWAHGFFLPACPSCSFQESSIPGSKSTGPSQGSWRLSPGSSGSGIALGSAEKHQMLTPEVRGAA